MNIAAKIEAHNRATENSAAHLPSGAIAKLSNQHLLERKLAASYHNLRADDIAEARAHCKHAVEYLELASRDPALLPRTPEVSATVNKAVDRILQTDHALHALHRHPFEIRPTDRDLGPKPQIRAISPRRRAYEAVAPSLHLAANALSRALPKTPAARAVLPDTMKMALDVHKIFLERGTLTSDLKYRSLRALDAFSDKLNDALEKIKCARTYTNNDAHFNSLVRMEQALIELWRPVRVITMYHAKNRSHDVGRDPNASRLYNQTQIEEFRERMKEYYAFDERHYTPYFNNYFDPSVKASDRFKNFFGLPFEKKNIPREERQMSNEQRLASLVPFLQQAHEAVLAGIAHYKSLDLTALYKGTLPADAGEKLISVLNELKPLLVEHNITSVDDGLSSAARELAERPVLHTTSEYVSPWQPPTTERSESMSSNESDATMFSESTSSRSSVSNDGSEDQHILRPHAQELGSILRPPEKMSYDSWVQKDVYEQLSELQKSFHNNQPERLNVDILTALVGHMTLNPELHIKYDGSHVRDAYKRAIQVVGHASIDHGRRSRLIEYLLLSADSVNKRVGTAAQRLSQLDFRPVARAYFDMIDDKSVRGANKRHLTLVASRALAYPNDVVFGASDGNDKKLLHQDVRYEINRRYKDRWDPNPSLVHGTQLSRYSRIPYSKYVIGAEEAERFPERKLGLGLEKQSEHFRTIFDRQLALLRQRLPQ